MVTISAALPLEAALPISSSLLFNRRTNIGSTCQMSAKSNNPQRGCCDFKYVKFGFCHISFDRKWMLTIPRPSGPMLMCSAYQISTQWSNIWTSYWRFGNFVKEQNRSRIFSERRQPNYIELGEDIGQLLRSQKCFRFWICVGSFRTQSVSKSTGVENQGIFLLFSHVKTMERKAK